MVDRMAGDGSLLEPNLSAKDATTEGDATAEPDGPSFLSAFTDTEPAQAPFKLGLERQTLAPVSDVSPLDPSQPPADDLDTTVATDINAGKSDKSPQGAVADAPAVVPSVALSSAPFSGQADKPDTSSKPVLPHAPQTQTSFLPVADGLKGAPPQTIEPWSQAPNTPPASQSFTDTVAKPQAKPFNDAPLVNEDIISPAKHRLAEEANMQLSRTQRSRPIPEAYKFINLMTNEPDAAKTISPKQEVVPTIAPRPPWESTRPAPQTATQPPPSLPQQTPFSSAGNSALAPSQATHKNPATHTQFDRLAELRRDTPRHALTTDSHRTPPSTTAATPATNILATAQSTHARDATHKDVIFDDMALPQSFDDKPTNIDRLRATPPPQSPAVPQRVAEQIAQIAQNAALHRREVLLNPEELGRVRLNIQTHETTVHVAILVERPETLDLMRRHISQLSAEFRDLGYRDVSFDFNQGSSQGSAPPQDQPSSGSNTTPIEEPDTIPTITHPGLHAARSLDLRI